LNLEVTRSIVQTVDVDWIDKGAQDHANVR
jgi:hypothetical protein